MSEPRTSLGGGKTNPGTTLAPYTWATHGTRCGGAKHARCCPTVPPANLRCKPPHNRGMSPTNNQPSGDWGEEAVYLCMANPRTCAATYSGSTPAKVRMAHSDAANNVANPNAHVGKGRPAEREREGDINRNRMRLALRRHQAPPPSNMECTGALSAWAQRAT